MRTTSVRPARLLDLRRLIERLDGLPVRPASARVTLDMQGTQGDAEPLPSHPSTELDPGWVLARLRPRGEPGLVDPLAIVADSPWWSTFNEGASEALSRLWRHAVATSLAARRLAREAGDADPGHVARAALLNRLGLWAIAAVDPDRLAIWIGSADESRRRDLEISWVGTDAASLGRTLAQRWGCGPLVADAAWLHDDPGDLAACADSPERMAIIRQAHVLAEATPWSLGVASTRAPGPLDPRIRLLMAEVQTRCGGAFVELGSLSREEGYSRENATLRLETARLRGDRDGRDRLISAMAESDPTDRPEIWAERAGLAWCDLPNVVAAKVVWLDPSSSTETEVEHPSGTGRTASLVLPLGSADCPRAEVHIWTVEPSSRPWPGVEAWGRWADLVADRARLRRKLDAAADAVRRRVAGEETDRRKVKLDALAEFAGGAGHELNNPLAVILGRAQLLLAREDDPESIRSLRAIIVQAQRAHRILRDLMYIARPADPRPRACIVDEILRASLRDAQVEAEARGVRLVGDPRPSLGGKVWADPDPIRHVADILVRNALEATPSGGTVSVGSSSDDQTLRWTIKDNGRGLSSHEGAHLFDPFFCGRQAGRGLGLGLPRAARIVERAGGELTWQSTPGQGTSFLVKLPLATVPPSPVVQEESA